MYILPIANGLFFWTQGLRWLLLQIKKSAILYIIASITTLFSNKFYPPCQPPILVVIISVMKIERLELNGFKSFAEKTTFSFHPGITCIVGPNGCGKSNIVDAVRWVLGEQSAKTLRGDKMDEVIFNGSQSRKPKGMAEVTLYIAFPDSQDNGQKGERIVTVTRRLYRSGESEYLINKNLCRLKDIREMFLDTGLEIKRYSILEQGSIGELINAKPQDRRFLIEEVAGVMKYKARKTEAIAKLESSRLNLQRISDILSEVKRQRNSLDRQAKKAARYKKLLDQLKELELRVSKTDFNNLKLKLESMEDRINQLKNIEAEKRKIQTEIEAALEVSRIEIIEKEKQLETSSQNLERIEREIGDSERTVAIIRRDMEYTKNTIQTLKTQIEESEILIKEKEKELASLSGKDNEIKREIAQLEETLSSQEEEIRNYQQSLKEIEDSIKDKRRDIFKISDSIGEMKNLLHRHEATLEGTKKRAELCKRELDEAYRRIGELKEQSDQLQRLLLEKESLLKEYKTKRNNLNNELSQKKSLLNDLYRQKSNLREEILSLQSRARALDDMITSRKEQEILKSSGINILSTLSEVIEVDPSYDVAVEAALSERLKGIMLSTHEELKKAIDIINSRNLPRHVFIYKPKREGSSDFTDSEIQGLKPLSSLISSTERFKPLIDALLTNYYIVDDIDKALEIFENNSYNKPIRLVTFKGEVVETEGVIVAGKGTRILRIRRELKTIEKTTDEKNRKVSSIETEIEHITKEIDRIKNELKSVEEEIISTDRELSLQRATEKRLSEDMERFSLKSQNLEIELEQLNIESDDIEQQIIELETNISQKNSQKISLEQSLESMQLELTECRERMDEKLQSISEIKIRLKGLTERLESYNRESNRLKEEIVQLSKRKETNLEEISGKEALIRQKSIEAEKIENNLKNLVEKADKIRKEISMMREELQLVKNNMTEKEDSLRKLRRAIEEIKEDLHKTELQWTEHSMKIDALRDTINEKYNMDIEDNHIEPSTSYEEDRENLNQIKEKIQSMGQVNIGALDEFNELNERYEFLQRQHDDIVQSIDELEEAIRRINRTTRKMLSEAYEALNSKFNEVFQRLFDGGSAELRLTDENNILESGIEVIVRPPGKRLQNISLLSGGEKALAALSLMFAGFLLKPTPLCILDEADAPLDESNTVRFRTMIEELSKEIQFIVITHNKITMEAADYLYGITMDEPGVSKVLSMEFVEG